MLLVWACRWADVPESRASRLERQGISSEDFRLARSRRPILVMVGQSTIPQCHASLKHPGARELGVELFFCLCRFLE